MGDPDELERRAMEIRDRYPFPGGWSDFVIRRVPGTSLTAVIIDDPSEEVLEAFRQGRWQYGGSV